MGFVNMSLNVTITGDIYNTLGNLYTSTEIYYQVYFHKINSTSSFSVWGNVHNSIAGQYNFNLADSDLLTTEGSVGIGDKVIVVFWRGSSSDRDSSCTKLIEWVAIEVVLTSATLYVIDAQTKPNIPPDLIWGIDTVGYVNTDYVAFNNSDDEHTWYFNNTAMNHWSSRYGQDIQLVNNVLSTSYFWGDGYTTLNLSGAEQSSHSWGAAGVYTVNINIEDRCQTMVSGTELITIKNHAPDPDIVCHQSIDTNIINPNTPITFEYSGTDVDNTIISIDWHISDSGIYGNTDTNIDGVSRDELVPHMSGLGTHWYGTIPAAWAFTNPGSHEVAIVVVWDDGFVHNIVTYSKVFIQDLFSEPSVDFTQVPSKATVSWLVAFDNTSSNRSRVGTSTPDGHKYDWEYNDCGNVYSVDNLSYIDSFSYTPVTSSGIVTLTASWNDGWKNYTSNKAKNITFVTAVAIVDEECYYSLHITGTSDDGTVTGYNWEVYKDIDGEWVLTWKSPIGIEQNDKKVCFTSIGLYRIKGFIYGSGTTTEAYIDKEIDLVCPTEAYVYIWNGTGIEDVGGDWTHGGAGYETPQSKRSGTNGLDLSQLEHNSKFSFSRIGPPISTSDYDFISLYVKVLNWDACSDIYIRLHNIGQSNGISISLKEYLHIYSINEWQHAFIPLSAFEMYPHMAGFIDALSFKSSGNIGIYIDDIMLGVGSIITRFMNVCSPDMHSYEVGEKSMQAHEIKPSMKITPRNRSFPEPLS